LFSQLLQMPETVNTIPVLDAFNVGNVRLIDAEGEGDEGGAGDMDDIGDGVTAWTKR
jgi:hypothetical protein